MLNNRDEKIFIDLDDEITFVVERIKSSDADRIILVAPEGAGVVSSLVSLKLLAKQVFKFGKSVVLVTEDDKGVRFAKRAGIATVRRIGEVSEDLWVESEERLKRRGVHPVLGRKVVTKLQKEKVSSEKNVETVSEEPKGGSVENVGENEVDKVVPDVPKFMQKKSVVAEKPAVAQEASLEDFGFVVGKDIEVKGSKESLTETVSERRDSVFEGQSSQKEVEAQKDFYNERFMREDPRGKLENNQGEEAVLLGKDVSGIKIVSSLKDKLKGIIRMPKISVRTVVPILIFAVILLSVGGVYAYFITPTAEVNLTVKYETINMTKDIVATTDIGDVDLAELRIPFVVQEIEESGSESTDATGTEDRGEKAKGTVAFVNKMDDILEVASGTSLTGNDLVFILLEDIELPGGDEFDGYTVVSASVEAYDIGEEYNVAGDTKFTVEGYATTAVSAKTFDGFAGGTKEEVQVVIAEDHARVKESLEESLRSRAESKLREQIGGSFVLNDAMINIDIIDENYDAPVGDEAQSINLNLKVRAKALVYSTEDLKTLGMQILQAEVSSGLKLQEDKSEFVPEFMSRDGDSAHLRLDIKGVIEGDVTEESVQENLAGKKPEEVESYLSELEGVEKYSITYGPDWLPESMWHVPSIKDKVVVNISL